MARVVPVESLSPGDLIELPHGFQTTVHRVDKEQVEMAPLKFKVVITITGGRQLELPFAHPIRVIEPGWAV